MNVHFFLQYCRYQAYVSLWKSIFFAPPTAIVRGKNNPSWSSSVFTVRTWRQTSTRSDQPCLSSQLCFMIIVMIIMMIMTMFSQWGLVSEWVWPGPGMTNQHCPRHFVLALNQVLWITSSLITSSLIFIVISLALGGIMGISISRL